MGDKRLRVAQRFTLSAEQEAQLQAYARGRKVERRLVERARIVLLAAEGKENLEIAARLEVSRHTVARWGEAVSGIGH